MNGEAQRRETALPAPSRGSGQRHAAQHFGREGLRGHDRPVVGAARAVPAVETAARAAPHDPARRLIELTAELGHLAGEIAQGAPGGSGSRPNAQSVRAIIRARRRRAEAFGADLFADPVWDMMLDLLAARLEGRPVSTSSLCIAAGVPGTTALRWIRLATERGLFVRVADPRDRRGVLVTLSEDTAEHMLEQLAADGSPLGL